MTRYGVTGVVDPPDEEFAKYLVYKTLIDLPAVDEFTTGGAYGIDTIAAKEAMKVHPNALHRLCVPAAPFNRSISGSFSIIEYVPAGKSVSDTYMARNDRIVAYSDVLLAWPLTAVEELRSGTWATIRRARKQGKEVRIYPLT